MQNGLVLFFFVEKNEDTFLYYLPMANKELFSILTVVTHWVNLKGTLEVIPKHFFQLTTTMLHTNTTIQATIVSPFFSRI